MRLMIHMMTPKTLHPRYCTVSQTTSPEVALYAMDMSPTVMHMTLNAPAVQRQPRFSLNKS